MNITGSDYRKTLSLKEIEDRGSASVVDLALRMGVSEMTIRRDLTDLQREGIVRRVHGGAVSARGRSYEPPMMLRAVENQEAKRRIGEAAARLVADGDSIALDSGSTTLEIARNLAGRRNLTVITSSLYIAYQLLGQPDIRLILSGGIVRSGEASLIGDLAHHAYANLFVDRLFLGVGAVDVQAGLTEYNWDDTLVKQAMIRSAKEVILVADLSKFGRAAFAKVAPLSAVHHIITDGPPPAEMEGEFKRLGIVVHVANPAETIFAEPEMRGVHQ
ncbi:MAG: DeoR/GlpR family DNA-binding transcription regulator [Chloroflexi bacterium]|nr:DeoR/GlpR family DNA-binding transcription regulator [Chloroflexota bacterium]